MIFICENCRYLFEADLRECRCVDCGKLRIRPAVKEERREYWKLQEEFYPEREIPEEYRTDPEQDIQRISA